MGLGAPKLYPGITNTLGDPEDHRLAKGETHAYIDYMGNSLKLGYLYARSMALWFPNSALGMDFLSLRWLWWRPIFGFGINVGLWSVLALGSI